MLSTLIWSKNQFWRAGKTSVFLFWENLPKNRLYVLWEGICSHPNIDWRTLSYLSQSQWIYRVASVQMPSQNAVTLSARSYLRVEPGCGSSRVARYSFIIVWSRDLVIRLMRPKGVTGLSEYAVGRLTILVKVDHTKNR